MTWCACGISPVALFVQNGLTAAQLTKELVRLHRPGYLGEPLIAERLLQKRYN